MSIHVLSTWRPDHKLVYFTLHSDEKCPISKLVIEEIIFLFVVCLLVWYANIASLSSMDEQFLSGKSIEQIKEDAARAKNKQLDEVPKDAGQISDASANSTVAMLP